MKLIYILLVNLLLIEQIVNCKSFIGICQKGQTSKLINSGSSINNHHIHNNNDNSFIKIGNLLNRNERELHESYMKIAVDIAIEKNNKYASIIVSPSGSVLCSGVDSTNDNAILKSELLAIINCSASYSISTFEGHTIYSTSEPDSLSSSAIVYARFKSAVWGSSINDLYCRACLPLLPIDPSFIFSKSYGIGLNTPIEQISGILKDQTDALFNSQCSNALIRPKCQCIINNSNNNSSNNTTNNNNHNNNQIKHHKINNHNKINKNKNKNKHKSNKKDKSYKKQNK